MFEVEFYEKANGDIKKTQKTPKKEIDLAKKCRKEYIKRLGE